MKRIWIITGAAAMLLSACGGHEEPEVRSGNAASEETAGATADETVTASGENKIHQQEVEHSQPAENTGDYEEMDHIESHFSPDEYEIRVANDNPGNRVLLFMDGETPVYKTVYIKDQGSLKIIGSGEGLVDQMDI